MIIYRANRKKLINKNSFGSFCVSEELEEIVLNIFVKEEQDKDKNKRFFREQNVERKVLFEN